MVEKHRVLIVADSPFLNTGFGYLHRELGKRLHDAGYEIQSIGLWDQRQNMDQKEFNGYSFPWPIYISKPDFQKYAYTEYMSILESYKPTLIYICTDIWIGRYFMNTPVTKIYYFHVEGEPLPTTTRGMGDLMLNWPFTLLKNEYLVFAGPFGKDTTLNRVSDYIIQHPEHPHISVLKDKWPIIPNGVNTDVFAPIYDKIKLKTEIWNLDPDDFVIGFFNRQNARKGLPYILEAFAKWPNRPQNAYVYCHCAMKDKYGWNLEQMITDLKIEDKVIVNAKMKLGGGVSYQELNKLYNACDIIASPSLGEGFGQTTCVLPNAIIKTDKGYKKIQNIKKGDMVATHMGRFQEVLAKYKTKYKGDIRRIFSESAPAFSVTPTHRVLAKKPEKSRTSFGYEAKDLSKGDFLKYPIMHEKSINTKIKNGLREKIYTQSEDHNLIYKYRDILLSYKKAVYNIIDAGNVSTKDYTIKIFKNQFFKTIKSIIKGKKIKYILNKIKDNHKRHYKGFVYNMNVANDHSFVVNGAAAVHNCQALSAGVPVIITDYSELKIFDKGTIKLKPIAMYVETGTNIHRAIPDLDDLINCYKKSYKKKYKKLIEEARDSVLKYDWDIVGKQWLDFFDSIPVEDLETKLGYKPNLDEWKYDRSKPNVEPVSIIICNKDKPDLLQNVVESILKTVKTPYELIIHDTGSVNPSTHQLLDKY